MYLTLVLLIVLTIFVIIKPNKKQEVNVINEAKEQNSFAIYKDDGTGNYVISSDTSFPTKGYILNMEKTKCFDSNNNGIPNNIVSQSLDGKITLQATQASYCDLYFAKDDDVPVVTTFSIAGTKENNETLNSGFTHKVNVTYNIRWSATDVVSYCISTSQSSCNGSWVNVSGTSVSPTEPALDNTEGKKTRYAFIKDIANNISGSKEASITLDLNNPAVTKVTYKSKDTSSITVKVEGSDGTTGSGVVKYECSAKEKGVWFPQDTNGNCKVTGLNDNTSYTIEGRVTDSSGRVSTNNVSTTQSTEAAYSCSAGEELVQDAQKGSSSGGYICTASASSKGWYNTTTYWTCSLTGSTEYDSEMDAQKACKTKQSGTCSSYTKIECTCDDGTTTSDGWCYEEGVVKRESVSFCCEPNACSVGYGCRIPESWNPCSSTEVATSGYRHICQSSKGRTSTYSLGETSVCNSQCGGGACFSSKDGLSCPVSYYGKNCSSIYTYRCNLGGEYTDFPTCVSSCFSWEDSGSVESGSQDEFYCPPGWVSYKGEESSLQCYRAATKG